MSRGDLTRDRKVKVALFAMVMLFAGLVCGLVTLHFSDDGATIGAGLYGPFCLAVGAVLRFFVDANVKVHQAKGGEPPPGGQP